jgi:hypothetical protein
MVWFKRFSDPIILPDGRELLTLRDAAEYITALQKAEHDAADWQVAMVVLSLVAERDGPELMARIAVMKALNRHSDATPAPRRKPAHGEPWVWWGESDEPAKWCAPGSSVPPERFPARWAAEWSPTAAARILAQRDGGTGAW